MSRHSHGKRQFMHLFTGDAQTLQRVILEGGELMRNFVR